MVCFLVTFYDHWGSYPSDFKWFFIAWINHGFLTIYRQWLNFDGWIAWINHGYLTIYDHWGWNIFDFFLVVFSFSEVAISRMLVMNQPGPESSASLNVGPGLGSSRGWTTVAFKEATAEGDQRSVGLPSGYVKHSYWTWPLIVDFPIENGDFP